MMSTIRIDRSTVGLMGRVYGHLTARRRRQLAALALLMIVSSFVEAISIGSILPFLGALTSPDRVLQFAGRVPLLSSLSMGGVSELRLVFTLIFVGLIAISGLIRILYFWLQTRLSMAISIDFGVQVYERTLYQPYAEIVRRNSSEILAGAHKARDLVGYLIQPALTFVSSMFMLSAVLITLFVVQPTVAISGVVGFGGLYLFATTVSKRLLQFNSRTYAAELGRVNKAIQEGIGGIRDVIIDGTQATFSGFYRNALSKMQHAAAGNVILAQMPRYIVEMLGMMLLAGIAYLLMSREGNFVSTIPALGLVALGAQRLLPVLQQAYAAYVTIRGGFDSSADALDLLDQPFSSARISGPQRALTFRSTLTVENLRFGYAPESQIVLSDINLRIRQGERVGFIGATGSGKSTLVDLLMGLLMPTSGSIYVDGEKLCAENIREWHACISHVPQSIFLADSTIAENIAFGVEARDIDMARVREAAQVAQISVSIEGFPDGYQTRVGERGVRLSGGQRQRIGIARAIYRRSRVLVFDEATSALDAMTEANVMDAIHGLGRGVTVLLIAHRISTLRSCDSIVELRHGVVSWHGTYQELTTRH
jgi:ABC-type multidrug transport system fused ATPase/permease subunit